MNTKINYQCSSDDDDDDDGGWKNRYWIGKKKEVKGKLDEKTDKEEEGESFCKSFWSDTVWQQIKEIERTNNNKLQINLLPFILLLTVAIVHFKLKYNLLSSYFTIIALWFEAADGDGFCVLMGSKIISIFVISYY